MIMMNLKQAIIDYKAKRNAIDYIVTMEINLWCQYRQAIDGMYNEFWINMYRQPWLAVNELIEVLGIDKKTWHTTLDINKMRRLIIAFEFLVRTKYSNTVKEYGKKDDQTKVMSMIYHNFYYIRKEICQSDFDPFPIE